jgi:hypothetical protein
MDLVDLLKDKRIQATEFPQEFQWTFVITHETEWCGPYFSRR